MVYIAPPSPWRQITGLSGAPIAAPVAKGNPWPMDPPVRANQSRGFAFHACGVTKKPEVAASSHTTASSGKRLANKGPKVAGSNSPEVGACASFSGIKCPSIEFPFNISFRAWRAYFPS